MWHVSAVPLEWAINPNFRLTADGQKVKAVVIRPAHNTWHLWVCERNSRTKNQNGDILVSYDVTSLLNNVPLDEPIQILADKAFNNNCFNETHHFNFSKVDLVNLLKAATKDQLIQFDGRTGRHSHHGPLLANVFMAPIEETLESEGKMPSFNKRYVDDTLTIMPDTTSAASFLKVLNNCYP